MCPFLCLMIVCVSVIFYLLCKCKVKSPPNDSSWSPVSHRAPCKKSRRRAGKCAEHVLHPPPSLVGEVVALFSLPPARGESIEPLGETDTKKETERQTENVRDCKSSRVCSTIKGTTQTNTHA